MVQPLWQRRALLSLVAYPEAFAFYSRFAFSSERCDFVANRNFDVVGSGRVASLRLSFELRLEIALSGLFSLCQKIAFGAVRDLLFLPSETRGGLFLVRVRWG
jgi:hypothetical protein